VSKVLEKSFTGGSGLTPGSKTKGGENTEFTLAEALRDVADDLQNVQGDPSSLAAQTQEDLTDSSGGTPATTIAAITQVANAGSADVGPTADAIASLAAQLAKIKADVAVLAAYAVVEGLATQAALTCVNAETYDLLANPDLKLEVDGGDEITITFDPDDFVDPELATAAEVVAAMLKEPQIDLYLTPSVDVDKVKLELKEAGANHSFQITGGAANGEFAFSGTLQQGTGYGLLTQKA
jgi:hypothetical protein